MGTAVLCGILLVLCFIGARSMVKRMTHGCCGGGGDEVKRIKVKDKVLSHYPYTYIAQVEGMTCGNCRKRVENAFHEQGNFYAVVDLNRKTVKLHAKNQVSEEEINRVIWGAGYEPGNITRCE